jgi:hypothetical protein
MDMAEPFIVLVGYATVTVCVVSAGIVAVVWGWYRFRMLLLHWSAELAIEESLYGLGSAQGDRDRERVYTAKD